MTSKSFFLIILGIIITGCGQIHYKSSGQIPVLFTGENNHVKHLSFKEKKHIFLWGYYPESNIFWVDQLFKENRAKSVSRLRIYEYQSPLDVFLSFITLGLYTPRSIEFSGQVIMKRKES